MEVVSPGANGQVPPTIRPTIDPNTVVDHLVDLLAVTLGASSADLEHTGSLLSPSQRHETIKRCTRFASEAHVALYVQKDTVRPEPSNGEKEDHDPSGKFGNALITPVTSY